MPRLATVVPRVVSRTVMPMTSPKVKMLLTSGRPNSVVLANSASRCNGCGFIVIVVNSTLSVSVTVRVSAWSNTCLRKIPRNTAQPLSPALEHGPALLVEGGDRLLVVLGEGTARLVRGFELEHGLERLGLGGEQIALHIAERHPRSVSDAPRQCDRLLAQRLISDHLVDDAQPARLVGVNDVGGEIEFARLGGADQPGQAPRAAVIARIADPREGGAEPRRLAGDAQISGEREAETGAGHRAADRGAD